MTPEIAAAIAASPFSALGLDATVVRGILEEGYTIPSPVQGQNVYSHGGRGIYLINQLMDEVKFDKKGTEIRMMKR